MLKPICADWKYSGIKGFANRKKSDISKVLAQNELFAKLFHDMQSVEASIKSDFVLNKANGLRKYFLFVLNKSKERTKMFFEETEKDINDIVDHMQMGLYIPAVIGKSGNLLQSNRQYTHVNEISFHQVASMLSALKISRYLGMTQDEQRDLAIGMAGHDISKFLMGSIVSKREELTPEEEELLRFHPEAGFAIYKSSGHEMPQRSLDIVLLHHEKDDGTGYPFGLKGDQIPPLVKIARVADMFDALTDPERPYRSRPFNLKESMNIIINDMDNGRLDKTVVNALVALNRKGREHPSETGYYS